METTKENALVRYWQLIVVLLGLAATFGANQFQLNALADDVTEQNIDIEQIEEKEQRTEVDVAIIKKEVESVKSDVEEIKEDVENIDEKIDRVLEALIED